MSDCACGNNKCEWDEGAFVRDRSFATTVPSLELVRQFHELFEQPILDEPCVDDDNVNDLRVDLLIEELQELRLALDDRDVVGVLDALTDLQYVLDGAYVSLGFRGYKHEALLEVHRSNLSKLDENGRPIKRADGKVQKGPNYSPPNLKKILNVR